MVDKVLLCFESSCYGDGVATGTWKVLCRLWRNPNGYNGLAHIPAYIRLGGDRGFVHYFGQPMLCRNCGKEGHTAMNCEEVVCKKCRKVGHVAEECKEKRVCNLCGAEDHVFANCPCSYANKTRRDREEDKRRQEEFEERELEKNNQVVVNLDVELEDSGEEFQNGGEGEALKQDGGVGLVEEKGGVGCDGKEKGVVVGCVQDEEGEESAGEGMSGGVVLETDLEEESGPESIAGRAEEEPSVSEEEEMEQEMRKEKRKTEEPYTVVVSRSKKKKGGGRESQDEDEEGVEGGGREKQGVVVSPGSSPILCTNQYGALADRSPGSDRFLEDGADENLVRTTEMKKGF